MVTNWPEVWMFPEYLDPGVSGIWNRSADSMVWYWLVVYCTVRYCTIAILQFSLWLAEHYLMIVKVRLLGQFKNFTPHCMVLYCRIAYCISMHVAVRSTVIQPTREHESRAREGMVFYCRMVWCSAVQYSIVQGNMTYGTLYDAVFFWQLNGMVQYGIVQSSTA